MKIIPEKVIPAKVELTEAERAELWNFLLNEGGFNSDTYKTNLSWRDYKHKLQRSVKGGTFQIDAVNPDMFWVSSTQVSIKEFQDYCRRIGFTNGKRYQVA